MLNRLSLGSMKLKTMCVDAIGAGKVQNGHVDSTSSFVPTLITVAFPVGRAERFQRTAPGRLFGEKYFSKFNLKFHRRSSMLPLNTASSKRPASQ